MFYWTVSVSDHAWKPTSREDYTAGPTASLPHTAVNSTSSTSPWNCCTPTGQGARRGALSLSDTAQAVSGELKFVCFNNGVSLPHFQEPCHKNATTAYTKTKAKISFAVTAKLISAFVLHLCFYSSVCVGPVPKPHSWFFS